MAYGHIVVDFDRCKGCDLCRQACLPGVIQLADKLNGNGYRPVLLQDANKQCTGCALCAVVCPEGCITVYKQFATRPLRAVKEVAGVA